MSDDPILPYLVLIAFLSGIAGLVVNVRLGKTRPKAALALMIAIPTIALGLFTATLIYSPVPPMQRAGIYIQQSNFDAAINLLTPMQEKTPEDKDIALQLATAWFARGLLHAERNEKDKALMDLMTAQSIAPPDAHYLDDIRRFITIIETSPEKK